VNGQAAFLNGIRSIKRIIWFRAARQFIETAAVIYFSLYTVYAAWNRFGPFMIKGSGLFFMALGIALLSSFALAVARKRSFPRQLIDIDSRLGLQDRLSTAYEYLKTQKTSLFFDLLIQDAGEKISRIDKKKIFPKIFSWIHIFLAALILLNLLMAAVKYPSVLDSPDAIPQDRLDRIRTAIRQYTTQRAAKKQPGKETGKERLSKQRTGHFDKLADMLEKPPVRSRHLGAMLHKVLKEIQSEKTARARDLIDALGLNDIEDVSIEQIRQPGRLSAFQLRKLNELVNRMFDDQIPRSVSETLSDLDRYRRMEAYLEQIIEELENERFQRSPPKATVPERSGGSVPGRAEGQNAPGKADHPTISEKNPAAEPSDRSTGADRAGGGEDDAREDPDGESLGQGPSSPGRGKSQGRSDSSHEPDPLKGPGIQDKTATSERSELSVLIRSLTAPGEAKMETRPIIRDYRRSMESILQKEDIPLNYRQYIKNYFLSIGLRKEPSSSGRKQ
jgi:hypothetical protein